MTEKTIDRLEMAIPRDWPGTVFLYIITIVGVFFIYLAIFDLENGFTYAAPVIYLATISYQFWWNYRILGARRLSSNLLKFYLGSEYIEVDGSLSGGIRFGFRCFGKCYVQTRFKFKNVVSVKWDTGQASARAGRDVNDWKVFLWVSNEVQYAQEQHKYYCTPLQGDRCYGIGPYESREKTEERGLAIVNLLIRGGVPLVKARDCCYVREGPTPI